MPPRVFVRPSLVATSFGTFSGSDGGNLQRPEALRNFGTGRETKTSGSMAASNRLIGPERNEMMFWEELLGDVMRYEYGT